MRIQQQALPAMTSGTSRELHSFHFGACRSGKKVYIQSSLHADEIPGMLVAHYLRQQLTALESEIAGEIILVPVANPIGLAQDVQGSAFGRFDLSTGVNFNRGYRYLTPELIPAVADKLGSDPSANTEIIRQAARDALQQWQPQAEVEFQKKYLQSMAIDADIVLDLHCDNQAVMHLYAGTPLADATMPLAAQLGAHALLVTTLSGGDPMDENCSRHWWELAAHFGATKPIPTACLSITVELRGETEVSHELAQADANGIIAFLQQAGHIAGEARPQPEAICEPTPLEGVDPITAPHAGVLVFTKALGQMVEAGESIGDVIDVINGVSTPLRATVSGVLFARVARRYAQNGMRVAKIAGKVAFRSSQLLSM